MTLATGTKLGPYEILAPLGAGGMGEVYRATDTRLARTVAVKVLPQSVANDAERLQRFTQEARVLSALNHSNLLTVFDVGSEGGVRYLVSEFLEGQTLREAMAAGALPQRKLAAYGLQIANGLSAAHEKGIVHRDLKPENIFVTNDEHVKILDFGLAKQAGDASGFSKDGATLTTPAGTAPGTVLGTVGYMSPEQVRGQAVDSRSDIFSFGAILYEMATGKRAFAGDSGVETMNAILKEEPAEIEPANAKVSPGLERIVRHCLEKNPANRFQSARDLGFAIEALSGSGATASVAAIPGSAEARGGRSIVPWAIAGAMALIAIAAGAWTMRPKEAEARAEFAIPLTVETSHLAISPDGMMVAFVAPNAQSGANVICIQHVGAPAVSFLAGTEGASYPFWSPDDKYLGFFADGKLKKIPLAGGAPQILAAASAGRGGAWSPSGVIIFAPQASGWMMRVNADGTNLKSETENGFDKGGESSDRFPIFLPDGDHYLYLRASFTSAERTTDGIYIRSLATGGPKLIRHSLSEPGYAKGYLFYVDENRAMRKIAMDPKTGATSGEPEVLADTVGYFSATYWAAYSVAGNGTVIFNPTTNAAQSRLTWQDRSGKELGTIGENGVLANPAISPDETRVAVDIADMKANSVNEWIIDAHNANASRFTFDLSEDDVGVWSRDGSTIAYRGTATSTQILVKEAHGLQPAKLVVDMKTGSDDIVANSWTPDGKQILCTLQPGTGGQKLVILDVASGKFTNFMDSTAEEDNGQISTDGKWVAYASNETGNWEVYVTTFPTPSGKWQVSRGGGTEPRWRGDGKELFYIGANSTFTAVPISTGETFSSGSPTPLFRSQIRALVSSTDLFSYDVTKDGKRFLVNRYVKPTEIAPVHIILNATTGAQK